MSHSLGVIVYELLYVNTKHLKVTHCQCLTIHMVTQSECRIYPKMRHRAYFHYDYEFILMNLVAVPFVQEWFIRA